MTLSKGPNGWRLRKWGDIATLEYGKGLRSYSERQGAYRVFGTNGPIGWHNEYLAKGPGVIIGRKGAFRGVHFSADNFFVIDTAFYLQPKHDEPVNMYWAFCALKAFDINNIDSGTAIPSTSREAFSQIPVRVPPLDAQRRIMGILSAYDDLIEVNTRRIAVLEEMACRLFDEWFVKRVPRGQRGQVSGQPGALTQEWSISTIGAVCVSLTDGDWIETKDQGGSDYRLLQVSNIGVGRFIETGNFRYVTEETFNRLRCTEIMPGDLLIARMPKPTGRAWLVTEMPWKTITAVDVAIARVDLKVADPFFVLWHLNSHQNLALVEKNQSGTTRPRISRSNLASLPVYLPPLRLQHKFGDCVAPGYRLKAALERQNANLRAARDLLLPKLISGEIDLSGAERQTKRAVKRVAAE